MTQEERVTVGEAWLGLAQVYGKDLAPSALRIMLDAVLDLPFARVMSALAEWPKTSKHFRHPFPSEVRDLAAPAVSFDAEAQIASARIYESISRFGWNNGKEAKFFIGDLGWTVVKRMGGWQAVCESVGVSYDRSAFLAHTKAIAKAEAEYSRAGRQAEAPALPEPNAKNILTFSIKGIED